jgi:hypothetical protein
MTTFAELDARSSRELHERAVHRARRHLDVRFIWRLLEAAPAVDVARGDVEQAESDALHWSGQVADAVRDDDASLDARRPLFIDYLLEHGG